MQESGKQSPPSALAITPISQNGASPTSAVGSINARMKFLLASQGVASEEVFEGPLPSPTSANSQHKRYYCEQCDKTFDRVTALNSHLIMHLGQKDNECSFCKKGFARRHDMLRHERSVHLKSKRYCQTCDVKFKKESEYIYHKQIHDIDAHAIAVQASPSHSSSAHTPLHDAVAKNALLETAASKVKSIDEPKSVEASPVRASIAASSAHDLFRDRAATDGLLALDGSKGKRSYDYFAGKVTVAKTLAIDPKFLASTVPRSAFPAVPNHWSEYVPERYTPNEAVYSDRNGQEAAEFMRRHISVMQSQVEPPIRPSLHYDYE